MAWNSGSKYTATVTLLPCELGALQMTIAVFSLSLRILQVSIS